MSFSDAIGQVDQIVQWEQQLSDPAAATQSSGTAATGTSSDTSSSDASNGASFSNALAQAQAQEGASTTSVLDPTAGATGASGATDASGAASAGDLLSGGDSQLLSALQSATGSSSSSDSSSSLLTTLESALQSSGTTGTTTTAGASSAAAGSFGAAATSESDPRVQSMTQEADSLIGKPYVWGGGHNNFGPQSGYDCSGFVSAVLHAGGYLTSPQDTETLPSAAGIASGPGQYVTIYDRTTPGQQGHVIMEINGQFYESGGEQGTWGGGGGVQKISTPSASYLSSFNLILHPAGL
jgi:cell wall-associated NlpC family hydrolase